METLSLGEVSAGVPLLYVEAWPADGRGFVVVKVYFDPTGLEAAVAAALSKKYFDGRPLYGLQVKNANGVVVGEWKP